MSLAEQKNCLLEQTQCLGCNVPGFHAPSPGLKTWAGQGRFSPSSHQWIDKMSVKLACELKYVSFTSDWSPDRNICSCISVPKPMKTEKGTVSLDSH
ncbi:hypothetical protein TNCV_3079371 [Trichonephila clavipes]|nr:hypothetical protein TNCV_3079371 [Trichonephila clavipes]